MYRRILLTTDGSELAASAVPHAATLAAAAGGATVVVTGVIDDVREILIEGRPVGWVDIGPGLSLQAAEEVVAAQHAEAERQLADFAGRLAALGVGNTEQHVLQGAVGQTIVRAVCELGIDLVVMATHGRTGLGRALIGSVADHVVRHAPCPVLLVRPPAAD